MALNDLFVKIKGDASDFLRELKNAKKETVNYKGAINDLGRVVADLKALYALLSAADKNKAIGADLKDKIQQLSDKIKEYKGYIEDANSVKLNPIDSPVTPSFREQLRLGREDIMLLTLLYRLLNDADKQSTFGLNLKRLIDLLTAKMANMRDIQADVTRAISVGASDTFKYDALNLGIGIVSTSMLSLIGVFGAFGGSSELFQKSMLGIMAVSSGFRAALMIVNALQEEGAVYLAILASTIKAQTVSTAELNKELSKEAGYRGIGTTAIELDTRARNDNVGAILHQAAALGGEGKELLNLTTAAGTEFNAFKRLLSNVEVLTNKFKNNDIKAGPFYKGLLGTKAKMEELYELLDSFNDRALELEIPDDLADDFEKLINSYSSSIDKAITNIDKAIANQDLKPLENIKDVLGEVGEGADKVGKTFKEKLLSVLPKIGKIAGSLVGWGAALAGVYMILDSIFGITDKLKEAFKGNTEEIEKQKKALNDYVNEVRSGLFQSVGQTIGKLEALKIKWKECRTEGEKQLFLINYADECKEVTGSVLDLATAELVFNDLTGKFEESIKARARAVAGFNGIVKAYEKYYEDLSKEQTVKGGRFYNPVKAGDEVNGETIRKAGLTERDYELGAYLASFGTVGSYGTSIYSYRPKTLNESGAAKVNAYLNKTGWTKYSEKDKLLQEELNKKINFAKEFLNGGKEKVTPTKGSENYILQQIDYWTLIRKLAAAGSDEWSDANRKIIAYQKQLDEITGNNKKSTPNTKEERPSLKGSPDYLVLKLNKFKDDYQKGFLKISKEDYLQLVADKEAEIQRVEIEWGIRLAETKPEELQKYIDKATKELEILIDIKAPKEEIDAKVSEINNAKEELDSWNVNIEWLLNKDDFIKELNNILKGSEVNAAVDAFKKQWDSIKNPESNTIEYRFQTNEAEYNLLISLLDELYKKLKLLLELFDNADPLAIKEYGNALQKVNDDIEDTKKKLKGTITVLKLLTEEQKKRDTPAINIKGVKDTVGLIKSLYSGIVGCTDAWDLYGKTMNDADASSGDRFKALANAIFSTTDAIFSLIEGISALVEFLNLFNTVSSTASVANLAESASLIEKTAAVTGLTTAETANTTALIAGLEAKVAAETAAIPSLAAASLAKLSLTATENTAAYAAIPFAGPALAAAAMSEYMTLWAMAKIPMFAEGGIVNGNSRFGDYNIARVNSGEMILNGSQLKKLFSMLDSDSRFNTIGGNVEFKINGSTLRGVLNNDSKKRSKV